MATYSLSLTALAAGYVTTNEAFTIPDSTVGGGATITTGTLPGMIQAMQLNLPLLTKGPSGHFSYHRLDPERSTPSVPVLVKM